MDNKKIIGKRINSALAAANKKQKELAAALGVTDNTISYFVSGKRTPNTEQIIKIARFLNVSADYLLGLSDVQSTDIDTQDICKKIGCSEDVINNLINLYTECIYVDEKSVGLYANAVNLLNKYLSYPKTLEFLIYVKTVFDEKISCRMDGAEGDDWKDYEIKKAEEIGDFSRVYLIDKLSVVGYDDQIDAFSWRAQKQFNYLIDYLTALDDETEDNILVYRENRNKINILVDRTFENLSGTLSHDEEIKMISEFISRNSRIEDSSVKKALTLQSDMIAWIETISKKRRKGFIKWQK